LAFLGLNFYRKRVVGFVVNLEEDLIKFGKFGLQCENNSWHKSPEGKKQLPA
jgi:hypothetical protein